METDYPPPPPYSTSKPETHEFPPSSLPPSYMSSTSTSTTPCLSLTPDIPISPPQKIHMTGQARSPDFSATSTSQGHLFDIETDSTLVYHESVIHSTQAGRQMFYLKRKCNGDRWTYTAEVRVKGKDDAVKVLEIETLSGIVKATSPKTRLVFRDVVSRELDALDIQGWPSRSARINEFAVFYRDQRIGSVMKMGGDTAPSYVLDVLVPGIDPLLFVIFALVLDDRSMMDRRRYRRSKMAGMKGIGRGPGAGLVMAYGIGSI